VLPSRQATSVSKTWRAMRVSCPEGGAGGRGRRAAGRADAELRGRSGWVARSAPAPARSSEAERTKVSSERNRQSRARTASGGDRRRAGIVAFIRGTHYSRHRFESRHLGRRYRLAAALNWGAQVGDCVATEAGNGNKPQKINMSTGGKLPATFDFLFNSRLIFEHTGECLRIGGAQGSSEKGWL